MQTCTHPLIFPIHVGQPAHQTPLSFTTKVRLMLLFPVGYLGLGIGLQYVHLCLAGSRWIEGAAIFGTPLIAMLAVMMCRRLTVGLTIAGGVLLLSHACCRPYLDWIHGS